MKSLKWLERDLGIIIGVASLILIVFLVFATDCGKLGFYSDDAAFLLRLKDSGLMGTVQQALDYVPGRNLHIFWQKIIFLLVGQSPEDLGKLHFIQTALDAVTVVAFFQFSRALKLSLFPAFLSALIFALFPSHSETHFWLSAAPMNIVSTLFFLCFGILVLDATPTCFKRLFEVIFFAFTLFTYDQELFLLLLFLFYGGYKRYGWKFNVRFYLPYIVLALLFVSLKIHPSTGPTLSTLDLGRVFRAVIQSINLTASNIVAHHSTPIAAEIEPVIYGVLLLIVSTSLFLGSRKRFQGEERLSSIWFCEKVFLSICMFFAGYGPIYLWAISGRHNFLPSIGLCLGIGVCLQGLLQLAEARRKLYILAVLAISALISVFSFKYAVFEMEEKLSWIRSYQYRVKMYEHLAHSGALNGKKFIAFDGFPNYIGSAPCFAYENEGALNYLFPQQANLVASSLASVPTPFGYMLNVDYRRWGSDFSSHVIPEELLYLRYSGADAQQGFSYEKVAFQAEAVKALYEVRPELNVAVKGGAEVQLSMISERKGILILNEAFYSPSDTQSDEILALNLLNCSTPPVPFGRIIADVEMVSVVLGKRTELQNAGFNQYRFDLKLPVQRFCRAKIVAYDFRAKVLPRTLAEISIDYR